jgi:hypothetical protein
MKIFTPFIAELTTRKRGFIGVNSNIFPSSVATLS